MNHSDPPLMIASEGNTYSDSSEAINHKKQKKYWCGTTFDPFDPSFLDFIKKQKQYIYGFETCPTTERKHLQFYFESSNKSGIRFSSLKRLYPNIHFEVCKSSKEANFKYCSKEGIYISNIVDVYIPTITLTELYPWQKDIIDIIEKKADDRTIHWFWEPAGNVGKTTFAKFLSYTYNAVPLEGKKNDILYCAALFPSSIYIYDIERSLEEHLSYGAIEKIKNGYYMCAKYESKPIIRPSPHVICFANFEPQTHKLSHDRWSIHRLSA